jgi:hypothetical protein
VDERRFDADGNPLKILQRPFKCTAGCAHHELAIRSTTRVPKGTYVRHLEGKK